MVWPVDAASALADLLELSSQVDAAVVLGSDGSVVASIGHSDPERLARAGAEVWEGVSAVQRERTVRQAEVALREGSVFVVHSGSFGIVATTSPQPSSGLVLHDLNACLRALDVPKSRKRRSKAAADA